MDRRITQTVIGAVLALVVGAAAGSIRAISTTAQEREAAGSAALERTSQNSAKPDAENRAPVDNGRYSDQIFAEKIRNATGPNRWLLLLSAAENATAQDMPGLLRAARDDNAAIRMLAARWAELDPKHMLITLGADYLLPDDSPGTLPGRYLLSDVLFEEWTKTDLAGAIKALNELPSFSSLDNLRMTVANYAMKNDVEQGLRIMKEWNIRHYIPDMKSVAEWAARDPRRAARAVVQFGSDYAGLEALKQVGKAWATTDPEGGLRFAATLDPLSRATLATELMRAWAEKNVSAAAAFAAAQSDPAFRAALGQGLAATWGKTDPTAALAWSQEHLRGTARAEAIAGLIKAAAEKSLTTASQLVADMEPGAAQNRACASIFETWFKKGKDQRDAAFEWLGSLPDPQAQRAALERVQWNWAWNDPDGVRDFLAGPHGKLASPSLIHQVARNQAAKNPEAAMEWATKLPPDRADEARNAVLQNWLMVRPEGAAEYARKLPASPARDRAIETVTQTLMYQSPEQAAEWYRSLGAAEKKKVSAIFDRSGLSDDKRRQLQQAVHGP